jgi:phytol kinase
MEPIAVAEGARFTRRSGSISDEIRIELLRKSIHLSIALVPTLARIDFLFTVALLSTGIVAYALFEYLRLRGFVVPLVTRLTALAARRRDAGRFVLGPVTLGLGALLALLLYPNPAASIAIYALAFGDGLSSLVGKLFGSVRIPLTGGKSLEGSLTCFASVFIAAISITAAPMRSLAVALAATIVEAAPMKDFDNLLLPMATGAVATLLF